MQTSNSKLPVFVDYKDIRYLQDFLNPHARLMNGDKNDVPSGHQRKIRTAVQRARFMALLPYVSR